MTRDRHDFVGLREHALAHPLVRKADPLINEHFRFLPNGISIALSANR